MQRLNRVVESARQLLGEDDDAVVRQYISRIVNKDKKEYARAYWAWKQGGEEGAEPAHPNLGAMGAQAVRIAIAGLLKDEGRKQEMSLKSDDDIFDMFKKEYDIAVKQKLPPDPFTAAFTKTVIAARIRKPELEKILKDNEFKAEGAWSLMSEPAREAAFRKTPADQQAADFRKIMKDKQRKAPTDIPESRLAAALSRAGAL